MEKEKLKEEKIPSKPQSSNFIETDVNSNIQKETLRGLKELHKIAVENSPYNVKPLMYEENKEKDSISITKKHDGSFLSYDELTDLNIKKQISISININEDQIKNFRIDGDTIKSVEEFVKKR